MKKAVVLLSGGLDSATTLHIAKEKGFGCSCLIFDYGQRHHRELDAARKMARLCACPWQVVKISLPWKGSSLLDKKIKLPHTGQRGADAIPSTYVPGRNIIFLSFALSWAEATGARDIFIGAHAQDYSGYPDCRPEFYQAFNKVISTGTKAGIKRRGIRIQAPLLHKTKAQIVRLGARLGVPFEFTWSCYKGGRAPCGECDSCYFRAKGFKQAGIQDPLF